MAVRGARAADAEAVARIYAHPAYRSTAEDAVYVDPAARGRRHGQALLERLLDEARRAGVREVVAVVAVTDDLASVALHRACGFREAGRLERVGFKRGRWHDTLLLQRSLAPAPPDA